MKTKRKVTVAVTGLNAIDNPGSGVGVIRSLKEAYEFDLKIVGLSYETMEPGAYMHDLINITYQIPYPSAGSEQLMNRLMYIHSIEKLDLIIPNFDAELKNFIKISPALKQHHIRTFLPDIMMLNAIDKLHLHEFGAKHNFSVPKTKLISSVEEINDLNEDFTFPVFVKGTYYEAYKAHSRDQVKTYFSLLSSKWGLPVIIQENIEGTEIDVAGLGDGKGTLIGAVPMRKLYITDRGKGWSGVVLSDDSLIEIASRFVAASGWCGGFELEFVRTKDDELFLLEVNPRFPAWIYTTTAAGQNLPAALVKLAMGLPSAPYVKYEAGKMFVRYAWELITDITEFQNFSTQGMLSGGKLKSH